MSADQEPIGDYNLAPEKFLADLRSALEYQVTHCEIYRYMCAKRGFNPSTTMQQAGDEAQVPYVTSNAFKESRGMFERLATQSPDEITYWTVSSGTTGDRSIVGRTAMEMAAYRRAYRAVLSDLAGRETFDETLLFFPNPDGMIGKRGQRRQGSIEPFGVYVGYEAGDTRATAARRYLPYWDDTRKDYIVDLSGLFTQLGMLEASGGAVYLGGAPALMASILRFHHETGQRFSFGDRCKIQFGNGGWEVVQNSLGVPRECAKSELVKQLCAILGLAQPSQVDDSYGATETPAALAGHFSTKYDDFLFHQPPWLRLIIRNPQTLEPVIEPGGRGLLEVIMPYGSQSFCGAAILMDDVAELAGREVCPDCGREGMTIRIIGRAVDTAGVSRGCGAIVGS